MLRPWYFHRLQEQFDCEGTHRVFVVLTAVQWVVTLLLSSGCAHGIRKVPKTYLNKINYLRVENVGFQALSLRQLALCQSSRLEISVTKIPSICGLFSKKLLTAKMSARTFWVSQSPVFSKAPDCVGKVRRR